MKLISLIQIIVAQNQATNYLENPDINCCKSILCDKPPIFGNYSAIMHFMKIVMNKSGNKWIFYKKHSPSPLSKGDLWYLFPDFPIPLNSYYFCGE